MRAKINGQFLKQTFALTSQVPNGISSVSGYAPAVSTSPGAKNTAETGEMHMEYVLIGRRGPIGFAPPLSLQLCHSCVCSSSMSTSIMTINSKWSCSVVQQTRLYGRLSISCYVGTLSQFPISNITFLALDSSVHHSRTYVLKKHRCMRP